MLQNPDAFWWSSLIFEYSKFSFCPVGYLVAYDVVAVAGDPGIELPSKLPV